MNFDKIERSFINEMDYHIVRIFLIDGVNVGLSTRMGQLVALVVSQVKGIEAMLDR